MALLLRKGGALSEQHAVHAMPGGGLRVHDGLEPELLAPVHIQLAAAERGRLQPGLCADQSHRVPLPVRLLRLLLLERQSPAGLQVRPP